MALSETLFPSVNIAPLAPVELMLLKTLFIIETETELRAFINVADELPDSEIPITVIEARITVALPET
jgi:hypothetical protein